MTSSVLKFMLWIILIIIIIISETNQSQKSVKDQLGGQFTVRGIGIIDDIVLSET